MKDKPSPEALAVKAEYKKHKKWLIAGIKTFSLQQKALALLDDVCSTLNYGCELPSELNDQQKDEIINRVYIYAHGADKTNLCFYVHANYRKRIEQDYAKHVRGRRITEPKPKLK